MAEFKCERCLCVFDRKFNLVRHQNRKIQCKSVVLQKDDIPDMQFFVDKIKHMENEITKIKHMEDEITKMKKTINQQKNIINKQNKTINKHNVDNSKNVVNNVNNSKNVVNNVDNSTNVVNVMAFGKEDISFISDEKYKSLMNRGYAAPSAMTEHVHFNKDKPENHNIYVSNKKDKKYINVFDGEKWNVRMTKDVIEELKLNASELIKAKIDLLDPNNKKDAVILKKINRFIDSYDDEDESLNKFDEYYELMFYNNRDMVKKTHNL